MFRNVFIESDQFNHPKTKHILSKIKYQELKEIESIESIWGRVKKPYLQKRTTLDLFIGRKKGQLIKEAPDAYGLGREKHYYYIHAYNCIYECQYCYLQGFFNTPDIVLFINHDEIIEEMKQIVAQDPDCWFHAGEFSDSLAMAHITNELPEYFEFFAQHPRAKLELRTKAVNIRPLLELSPHDNIIISFSLSSDESAKKYDLRVPSIKHRLRAIEQLVAKGYMIGVHLDPIIYTKNFEADYLQMIEQLQKVLPNSQLKYISLGVVRFTKDVYHQVNDNYPDSDLKEDIFVKSFDGKVRYPAPMRKWIMNKVREQLLPYYNMEKIYLCMED